MGGTTFSSDRADGATSTLIANGGTNSGAGGLIRFSINGGQGGSGGSARVIINAGGTFDMSTGSPVSVGSIEGAGRFQLGSNTLTCGGLNTDTTVSGVLVDGGISPGGAGSLTKVGMGKLTLSGTNTYTSQTTVNGGALAIDGSIPGAIVVNSGATLNGIGTICGNVSGLAGGAIAPGDSPGTLTVASLSLAVGSKTNSPID